MIDFHTHILPDIDDGSSNTHESVKMIEMLMDQGVKQIVLTPHFYAYRSSANEFLKDRESSLKKLSDALQEKKHGVELFIGGEILYFEELWCIDDLKKFCIEGTNYILIELPFASWEHSVTESIQKLSSRGVVPIIAHFDRYLKYKGNKSKLKQLVDSGALLQMGCEYLNHFLTRRKAVSFFRRGGVFLIGSDCHNVDSRSPDFGTSIAILKKKLSAKDYDKIVRRQNNLLKSAKKISF